MPHIIKRWRAAARAARLSLEEIHTSGGYPVLFLSSAVACGPQLYLSAGVHGDEAAPVTALLEWAEENASLLRRLPLVIFPLFNPAGLAANTRADHRHIDLNRRFHDASHPHIKAWWKAVGDRQFSTAACLHEDYDAPGAYCYELSRAPRYDCGEALLRHCARHIPCDPRRRIEGRGARGGLIRRRAVPDLPGMPEAIALYMHSTPHSLTFETPSEFSLTDRIAAQRAFIEEVVRRTAGEV